MVELELVTEIRAPIERCFDLSRSIDLHLLGAEQTGERAIGGVRSGLIGPGESVLWSARHFGIRQRLAVRITAYDRPTYFQDTMFKGAFRSMQHDHLFQATGWNHTVMTDRFRFAAPIPALGILAERLFLRRYMRDFLGHRNQILKDVAESDRWVDFLPSD